MFDFDEVTFEVYIEDKLVNKQTMQAPKEMLMVNFIQTVKRVSMDKRPMKIRMVKPEIIWDKFDKQQKVLENEVVFGNNAMIAWEETNKKGEI